MQTAVYINSFSKISPSSDKIFENSLTSHVRNGISHMEFRKFCRSSEKYRKQCSKHIENLGKLWLWVILLNNPLLNDFQTFFQDFSEFRQYFWNSWTSHTWNGIPHMGFQGIWIILSELGEICKNDFSLIPEDDSVSC